MSAHLTIQSSCELGSITEQQCWSWLAQELTSGMQATESEFVFLDAKSVTTEARARKERMMK